MDGVVTAYRTAGIGVPGGTLRVGVWGPADARRTVLCVHGVTASHLAWQWLAEQMPQTRLVAPDLRGRGRSRTLPGPVGMSAHARDLVAVLDALDVERVDVVGHSMGGFIALSLAVEHPDRVRRAVLVDGGLPLELPDGMPPTVAVRHVLGRTVERLSMTFASVADYLDFWRVHPAFAGEWTPALERYFAYDLTGEEPLLRAATPLALVEEDSIDQNTGPAIRRAQAAIPPGTVLLAAERGLLDDVPPLYAPERRAGLLAEHPGLTIDPVEDVNHYTVAMSARGARRIAAVLSA